jgi:hypothetical protein
MQSQNWPPRIVWFQFKSFPKGYEKRDLTDGLSCYTRDYARDYAMERSLTGAQKRSRQPHLVKGLQKKEVEGDARIHEYSVELNILYNGAYYQGISHRLWYEVRVVATVKSNGDLTQSEVLRGGGFDRHDLPGCEFLLTLGLI